MAFTVRNNLFMSQRRYKEVYDKRVKTVNQALRVGDWVYVDSHDKDRKKLDQKVKGPYRIVKRDEHTFPLVAKGLLDRVCSDHIARAPTPAGQKNSTTMTHGPQEPVVPLDHEDSGLAFVWERFVGHDVDEDGKLWLLIRWCGYAVEEDTWEPRHKLDRAKVIQHCQRVGTEPRMLDEQAIAFLEPFKAIYAVRHWCLQPGADLWARC